MTMPRLIADVGGTNARFALVDASGTLGHRRRVLARDHPVFAQALSSYLARLPADLHPRSVAIAAAGPVADGRIDVTNTPWEIVADEVAAALGGAPVRLVNDLEAVALALPALGPGDVRTLRPGEAQTGAASLAVNVGTGFGAALSVPTRAGPVAVAAEPGHMRFAPATEEEREATGHVTTVEDLLSGRGLHALARALGSSAADSAAVLAIADEEAQAAKAVRLFAQVLGRISGDLLLATGAWGGLYLTGGVVDGWCPKADLGPFFAGLNDKGPMRARISQVPVHHITLPDPALLGLATLPMTQP